MPKKYRKNVGGSEHHYLNTNPQILLTPSSNVEGMTEVQAYTNGHQNGPEEFNEMSENADYRIAALEEKAKLQDMEILLLKSALSDVLNKLSTLSSQEPVKKQISGKPGVHGSKPLNRSASENVIKVNKTSPISVSSPSSSKLSRNRSMTSPTSPTPAGKPMNVSPPGNNQVKKKVSRTPSASSLSAKSNGQRRISEGGDPTEEENGGASDGKPKLILAPKRASSKKKKDSQSDDNNSSQTPIDDVVKFYIRGRGISLHRPTEYKENNPKGVSPEEKLKLSYVYGYRGKDCRDNIQLLPSGELVYNMAGVIVLHDHENNVQRHYTEHTDDVKCVAVHLNNKVCASGQVAGHGDDAKPHVRVWDLEKLTTLNTFGHDLFERGLCALEFSKDSEGKYLVCVDESNDHVVYLFDWQKGVKLAETNGSKEALFSIKWLPGSDSSFMSYGKSHIGFWKLNTTETNAVSITKKLGLYEKIAKPKYTLAAVYNNAGDVYSGDSNGNILVFREGSFKVSQTIALGAHKGGVFSLTYLEEQDILISGGKDFQFSTWNMQLEKLSDLGCTSEQYGPPRSCLFDASRDCYIVSTSKNCILKLNSDWSEEKVVIQGHSEEMWGLATHPTESVFVTCSHENLVCVWDSEKREVIWSHLIEVCAQSVEIHPVEKIVLVGTKNGTVHVLNYETKEELVTLPVSRDIIDDIKISPDLKYVAMASRDSCIYLYNLPKDTSMFKKPKILHGHSSRVLHLDWSADSEFLQSNSSDYEVLFWHAESGCQVLSPAALRDTEWNTFTCPFGFSVMGIWPEGADGTDINACCRSNKKDFIATGDDFGSVNLFKYPCVTLKSNCNVGVGHSSHVTNVRFLNEDKGLITIGGNDNTVMQWEISK